MRLKERHNTVLKLVEFPRVALAAKDVMTNLRKAGGGSQSDIARANDRNFHCFVSIRNEVGFKARDICDLYLPSGAC